MKFRSILAWASALLLTSVLVVFVVAVGAVEAEEPTCSADADSDGICDDADNCLGVANPAQYDADLDGYGNVCDYDVDNDCVVGAGDASATIAAFGQPAPHPSDVNELNGVVDAGDISLMNAAVGTGPIGPSGKSCAVCPSPVGPDAGACR